MPSRLILILVVLTVFGLPAIVSGFEYSAYCEKMCMFGRGGNLCKCNAVHFAGKRVVLQPKLRSAVLARYAGWRQWRMSLGPPMSNTRAPSLLRRLVGTRPIAHERPSKNVPTHRYGVQLRLKDWMAGSGRQVTRRGPQGRLAGLGTYSHQQEPKLYQKSMFSIANRLILYLLYQ
ncbi:hypothetical protein LSAT2_016248 [Lamellibrachia satsuma]|nr:hypothetical protein LSAT2_016248 [Lamellibrachia satsuma]